jgi:hypothetical protein
MMPLVPKESQHHASATASAKTRIKIRTTISSPCGRAGRLPDRAA